MANFFDAAASLLAVSAVLFIVIPALLGWKASLRVWVVTGRLILLGCAGLAWKIAGDASTTRNPWRNIRVGPVQLSYKRDGVSARVGTLFSSDGRQAHVELVGNELQIPNALAIGKYEGVIDLLPGTDNSKVKVVAKISDLGPYAFVTIALGVILASIVGWCRTQMATSSSTTEAAEAKGQAASAQDSKSAQVAAGIAEAAANEAAQAAIDAETKAREWADKATASANIDGRNYTELRAGTIALFVITGLIVIGSGYANLYAAKDTWGTPIDYLSALV